MSEAPPARRLAVFYARGWLFCFAEYVPGLALVALLAAMARLLGRSEASSYLVSIAILLGILIRNLFELNSVFECGTRIYEALWKVPMKSFLVTRILCALLTATVLRAQDTPVVVRVGYFPNITHSQPLIGKAWGWFEKALAPEARVEWRTFNAGPSAMRSHCGTDSGSLPMLGGVLLFL